MQLSKYFTLADLTKTDSGIKNVPDAIALENLKKFAKIADVVYDTIGPFSFLSAYRSPAVQSALKAGSSGAASALQASTTSYHMKGIAGDIVPKTMTAEAYMAKIAQNPKIKNMLGEIAVKKNALHISAATPEKVGVLMYVDNAGKYIRLKAEEISSMIERHKVAAGIGLGTIIALGIGLYFIMKRRK
ncbi:MAG: hypothetical protein H7836_04365 [Magnetococcus sp. YQC-3]